VKCSLASRHYKETPQADPAARECSTVFRPLARVLRLPALHEVSLVIPLLPGARAPGISCSLG